MVATRAGVGAWTNDRSGQFIAIAMFTTVRWIQVQVNMSLKAPRWYTALEQASTQNPNSSCERFVGTSSSHRSGSVAVFQLATIDEAGKPRVRSLINRAFLVPPSSPTLPLLVTSTDIRTPKIQQIAHADTVELVWYINATMDQFRISGPARIFAAPTYSISPLRDAPDCAGTKALEASGFDWETKRRELFDAVGEEMRATWCRPFPGRPLKGGYEEMDDWPVKVPKPSDAKTEREKELAELALSNYAIIVIEPLNVDWMQFAIKPNRRTFFVREGVDWKEEAVAP
jgi:pyridoxamine 5'-phosphate oxidase